MKHRALKISLAITGCALIASLVTIIVHLGVPRRQEITGGSILKGLLIEGMQIHRLDSSADALARLDSRPRCMGYPIVDSSQIPNPEIGGSIWTRFLSGLAAKDDYLSKEWREHSHFRPDWAMEIDNGDRIATILIDSKQGLAVLKFPTAGTHVYRIDAFPQEDFENAITQNYHAMPSASSTPRPMKVGSATFNYSSGGGSPSWTSITISNNHEEREQAGADQPATKPADKPAVKDLPSTPTPKNGPR